MTPPGETAAVNRPAAGAFDGVFRRREGRRRHQTVNAVPDANKVGAINVAMDLCDPRRAAHEGAAPTAEGTSWQAIS
jgi:hypothetical protein